MKASTTQSMEWRATSSLTRHPIPILVADDDPVCRHLLVASLQKAGYQVMVASDGTEAREQILTWPGAMLAILDWFMPGHNGLELCQFIRELPANRSLYAILLTGQTGREAVLAGLEAGADDFISKPFDHEELFARVKVGLRVVRLQQALTDRVKELEEALGKVRQLHGLLPICCYCKSIRTDQDYWLQVEHYITAHAEVQFSHGICPGCYDRVVEPQLQALKRSRSEKTSGRQSDLDTECRSSPPQR